MSLIKTRIENRAGWLTLNRPEKKNALNAELVGEIKQVLKDWADNDAVKVMVITGEGNTFSAGADLAMLQSLQSASLEDNIRDSTHLSEMFELLYTFPKLIIGALNGHAIAGGCGLATACDITIAKKSAKIGYSETRIGFVPAIVSKLVVQKVGDTQARRLLLLAEILNASEAASIGLITKVVDDSDFENAVQNTLDAALTQVSAQALKQTKQLLRDIETLPAEKAFKHAIGVNAEARGSEDCKKGIAAFLAKKPISW